MAITSDADLAQRIEALRSSEMCAPSIKEAVMLWAQLVAHRLFVYPRTTALVQRLFRYLTKKGLVVGSSSPREFAPAMDSDFFKAMSTMQARLGLRQLKKLEQNLAHRKKAAQLYDRLLEQKGWPARKYDSLTMEPVMVRYPVRIAEKNKALAESATAGIELGSWFECPLHPIETPLAAYDYTEGLCPESEKASREVVNLPLHHRVDEETAHRTVDFITRFAAAP